MKAEEVTGRRAVRRWFAVAEGTLQDHAEPLNRLNVFPVADSDTGLNMIATLRAAGDSLDAAEAEDTAGGARADLGRLLAAAGSQAMVAARGNSGTLLAVLISGFAEPLHGHHRLTLSGLCAALERGSLRAWSALSDPVSGTMLSVVDAVAEHLRSVSSSSEPDSRAELEEAMTGADTAARAAVVATEGQLEALHRAGVVDSGGAGVMLVVAALKEVVTGEPVDHSLVEGLSGWETGISAEVADRSVTASGVEIMCTLRLDPLGAASLRHRLDEIGDAVIITPVDAAPDAEGAYRWRVHIHTGDSERASEVLNAAGTVQDWQLSELTEG